MKKRIQLIRLITTAVLLAVGMVLPLLLGQVAVLGQSISPLHIPVLICGLTCGPVYGAALGFILPVFRSLIFGMPPMIPTALSMSFEMLGYGLLTGLLYPLLRRKFSANHLPAILIAMVIAMVAGRVLGGAAQAIILFSKGSSYTFAAFITAYFAKTAVGAVIHLIVVPVIVLALEKAKLSTIR